MFREKQESLLITAWTKVPAFASLLERSDKGTKIFMAAVRVGTLKTSDPL